MPVHPLWRPYVVPSDAQVAAARIGPQAHRPLAVVAPDPAWAGTYERLAAAIRDALGPVALAVEHVGSTSVPGLWAKPIIDVSVVVADPDDEDTYVPPLTARGLVLSIREPDWERHRLLRDEAPAANVHVWGPESPEHNRMRLFRDHLIADAGGRAAYGRFKAELAEHGFADVMHYNNAKSALVYDIYERAFAADPEHEHDPQPRPGR